jgi:hypothetical protein
MWTPLGSAARARARRRPRAALRGDFARLRDQGTPFDATWPVALRLVLSGVELGVCALRFRRPY